jgi:hypothetical protein
MAHAVTSFVDSYRVLAVLVLMPFGGALAAPGQGGDRPWGWSRGCCRSVALPGPHRRRRRRRGPLNASVHRLETSRGSAL